MALDTQGGWGLLESRTGLIASTSGDSVGECPAIVFGRQRIERRILTYLLVFIGGGIGAALRHAVNVAFARWFGTGFPFHTLFENVSGSLVMGLLIGYFAFRGGASQHLRIFMTTGFLGGFTTFSAFSLDAVLLWERHHYGPAALYVAASVIASLGGLVLGMAVV